MAAGRHAARSLALQLRQVEHGTVRSYRLFPVEGFGLQVQDFAAKARFVEHLPTSPWIHQPFEEYDNLRPDELAKKFVI